MAYARPGLGATFDFPQNYLVWGNKKIDSRPAAPAQRHNHAAHSSTRAFPGQQQPAIHVTAPFYKPKPCLPLLTLYLPCTHIL